MNILSRSEAEYLLRLEVTSDIKDVVGDEFDDHDREVIDIVLTALFRSDTAIVLHRAFEMLSQRCTAAEWQEIVSPGWHNWTFAPEVTT